MVFARPRPPRLGTSSSCGRSCSTPSRWCGATRRAQHSTIAVEGPTCRSTADGELIRATVLNLLLNAAQAMGGHGRIVVIEHDDAGCDDRGARQRPGHSAAICGRDLRAILHDEGARRRPWPADRPADRGTARRLTDARLPDRAAPCVTLTLPAGDRAAGDAVASTRDRVDVGRERLRRDRRVRASRLAQSSSRQRGSAYASAASLASHGLARADVQSSVDVSSCPHRPELSLSLLDSRTSRCGSAPDRD